MNVTPPPHEGPSTLVKEEFEMQSRSHPDDQEFEMQSSAHLADGVGNSSAPPQINGQSITPPTTNSEPELSPKISPNSPKQPPLQEQQHHSGLINGDIKQEYRDIKQEYRDIKQEYRDIKQDYRDIKLEDAHEYRESQQQQQHDQQQPPSHQVPSNFSDPNYSYNFIGEFSRQNHPHFAPPSYGRSPFLDHQLQQQQQEHLQQIQQHSQRPPAPEDQFYPYPFPPHGMMQQGPNGYQYGSPMIAHHLSPHSAPHPHALPPHPHALPHRFLPPYSSAPDSLPDVNPHNQGPIDSALSAADAVNTSAEGSNVILEDSPNKNAPNPDVQLNRGNGGPPSSTNHLESRPHNSSSPFQSPTNLPPLSQAPSENSFHPFNHNLPPTNDQTSPLQQRPNVPGMPPLQQQRPGASPPQQHPAASLQSAMPSSVPQQIITSSPGLIRSTPPANNTTASAGPHYNGQDAMHTSASPPNSQQQQLGLALQSQLSAAQQNQLGLTQQQLQQLQQSQHHPLPASHSVPQRTQALYSTADAFPPTPKDELSPNNNNNQPQIPQSHLRPSQQQFHPARHLLPHQEQELGQNNQAGYFRNGGLSDGMSAGVGGPGVGGPAVRGPGVGSPGIRGPVVGEPRGDVSGNLTQMQKEMMDEIPFGSPPHRGGHSKPADATAATSAANELLAHEQQVQDPYSEVKVQNWLTVNSPHFVMPPSPMGTMDDDASSEVSASNDSVPAGHPLPGGHMMPGGQMMPGPQMMPGGQMNHGHMMAGMNGVKGGKQKKTVGTNVPGRPDMIVDGKPRPKKYQNSYMLFCKDERANVAKENPEATPIEVARILGQKWRDLTTDMKKPYQEQAKIDKEVWVAKHGDYKNLPGIPKRAKKQPTTTKKPCHSSMAMEQGVANPVAAGGPSGMSHSGFQHGNDQSNLSAPSSHGPWNSNGGGMPPNGAEHSGQRPSTPDGQSSTGISDRLAQFQVGLGGAVNSLFGELSHSNSPAASPFQPAAASSMFAGGNPTAAAAAAAASNLPFPPYAHFPPIQLQGMGGGAGGPSGAPGSAVTSQAGGAGSWPMDRLPGFSYPGQDSNLLRSPFWSIAAQQQQLQQQQQSHHLPSQQERQHQPPIPPNAANSSSGEGAGPSASPTDEVGVGNDPAASVAAAAAAAAGYPYGAQPGSQFGAEYEGLIWGAMHYANGDYENADV